MCLPCYVKSGSWHIPAEKRGIQCPAACAAPQTSVGCSLSDEYIPVFCIRSFRHKVTVKGIRCICRHWKEHFHICLFLYEAERNLFPVNIFKKQLDDITGSDSHLQSQEKHCFLSQRQRFITISDGVFYRMSFIFHKCNYDGFFGRADGWKSCEQHRVLNTPCFTKIKTSGS